MQRVRWAYAVMQLLQNTAGPGPKFFASALSAMFTRGGSLERYLRLNPKRGSQRTPKWIIENLAPHRDEGTRDFPESNDPEIEP